MYQDYYMDVPENDSNAAAPSPSPEDTIETQFYFLLITTSILPAILSRCQQIRFAALARRGKSILEVINSWFRRSRANKPLKWW